ncbi:hypothetical protein HPTD01_2657 [Halomonas sp. TD01]|nr:hypothetical protein HPTD01_2657 [Halomonas sp. TD01]
MKAVANNPRIDCFMYPSLVSICAAAAQRADKFTIAQA